jgi:endonuclease G
MKRLAKKIDQLALLVGTTRSSEALPATGVRKAHRHPARTIGEAIARIVGGVPVSPGDYPDCVVVGRRRPNGTFNWFCSGVLVHPRIVITAGHCFDPAQPANVVALAAEDVDDLQNAEIRRVRKMVKHPRYPSSGAHDISVMILRRQANVSPVRLATAEEFAQATETTLVGFGNDDILSTRGFGLKREVTVPILQLGNQGNDDTEAELGFDSDLEFVAGGEGFDSCNGDSGGPAYITVAGERVVAGLTSRATETARNPCGDGGIYTRVDVHAAFIRRIARNWNITF